MSAVEIRDGDSEPIGVRFRRGATLTTGATVRARILRTSDGKELDWSTNTFVTSGTAVQPRQVLTETPASSGAYEYAWNTSTITNPTTPDTYLIEYDQTAPVVRAFIRQSEVRVRAAQSISAAVAAVPTAVWTQTVPGAFGAGSAGFVLGTNLDATVSSRSIPGDAMTLTAGERVAVGTAVWATATRDLTAGAITASTFSTDAIDSNALAASAAIEIGTAVWVSGTRTITGTTAGAITSASFAANALGAVWDELTASHVLAGSFGLLIGTDLDTTVSSRATDAGAASAVWASFVPGAFLVGSAGYALGTYLDVAVSTRLAAASYTAPLTATQTENAVWDGLTTAHSTTGSFGLLVKTDLDATISSRSTLTQAQILSDATPFQGGRIDAAISSRSTVAGIWSELLPGAYAAGSAGFNLDVAVSSRATDAGSASATWATVVPGAFAAGQAGYVLGTNLDALVSSRSTLTQTQILSDATPFTGAFVDAAISSRAAPGDAMALTPSERLTVQALLLSDATPFQGARVDAAISSRATVAGVWGELVPGAYALGSAGYAVGTYLDVAVSSRSTLTAVNVWSEALPGAYSAGQAGFYLDGAITSRATNAGAAAAVWGAVSRTLTSVVLDAGSLTSSVIGTGYLAAISGQVATDLASAHGAGSWATATGFSVPGDAMALTPVERLTVQSLVLSDATPFQGARIDAAVSSRATNAGAASATWDEFLAAHTTVGSAGAYLAAAGSGGTPAQIAAAVWATPEGVGTMGASLGLLRRRTTNRRKLDAGGTITFYDDGGLPEASALLTDVSGGPIVVVPGDPAESTTES